MTFSLLPFFRQLFNVVEPAITGDFESSCVDLPQLDKDLSQINYVDGLTDVFIDQWDRSRPNRRYCYARPE